MAQVLKKLIINMAIAGALLLQYCPTATAADTAPEGYDRISENSRLVLYADKKESGIAVKDKRNNYIWYSNPRDRAEDKIAAGVQKMNLSAQLLVTYIDEKDQVFITNNFTSSVKRESFKIEKAPDQVRFVYDFSRKGERFIIPVYYTLGEDCLIAGIAASDISEYGESRILDIAFLPFFGAGGMEDEGYLFVPDGSGALINFNNGKQEYKEYEEDIYGRDAVFSNSLNKNVKEAVRMPVFGIKNGDNAFLAHVSKGDALGSINASVSGRTNSYNNAFCRFKLRARDTAVLAESNWSAKDVALYTREKYDIPAYEVQFHFLQGEKADYSGMAGRYREIIEASAYRKALTGSQELPFYVDLYGAIKKKKSVLGLSMTVVEPLTTYADCMEIIKDLKDRGVDNIVIRYSGWMKGGMDDKVPVKAAAERKLGGAAQLKRLMDYAAANGVRLYPDVEFINIYKNGNGFIGYFSAARAVSRAPALQFAYRTSTYVKNPEINPWYLFSPGKLLNAVGRFLNSYAELGTGGLSLGSMGTMVYSDFNGGKSFDRQETQNILMDTLKGIKDKKTDVMVEGGNAYSLAYAGHVVDTPVYSSSFDMEDEEIPFYSMVLHGLMPYAAPPPNLSSDPEKLFLKAVETGCAPYYIWTASESSVLKETLFDGLYSSNYKDWIDDAVEKYTLLNSIYRKTGGTKIVKHAKLQEDVVETLYENGTRVVVNYNAAEVNINGLHVKARSYFCEDGGKG